MAKSDNGDVNNRLSPSSSNDPNNSFMKKVTSRVSGLIPSSLSKWFGDTGRSQQVIRRREDQNSDDEADDDSTPVQPPKKRARNAATLSDTTFSALSPSGFTITSTPMINHNDVLRVQAGPSGYSRQSNRETYETIHSDVHLNGDDRSDSGESTSGYSSVPLPNMQKESSSDKETKSEVNTSKILDISSGTAARSLFSEQSLNLSKTCLSSRRPSFNASTFGSPSFVDRTLTTKQIMSSPFYSGRTMFGGAAAYQRNRKIFPRDKSHRLAIKNSVQVKPVNETEKTESNHLSKTAKRILDCLEHFNSPVADAKKIPPVVHSRHNERKGKQKAPTKELQVPTVPELLKMKLKSRLQDSTVAVRNVATTSKSFLNTEYSLRSEETDKQKHSNKIKNKVASVREKNSDLSEIAQPVVLPEVQLPITTLPKFDFILPTPPAPKPIETITTTPKITPIERRKPHEFKFTSPILLSDVPKSIISVNNFKFSQPLEVKKQISFEYTPPTSVTPKKKDTAKNNGQTNEMSIAPAPKLISGSVMDILGKTEPKKDDIMDKFKPASGTWECSACMVRNIPSATRCIACETLRATTKKEETKPISFSTFKTSSDKWECSVCMIRNDNKETKCVACTNPKPGTVTNVTQSGFGDKFKPATNTWECSVCMIRNKTDASKCVACETPKPGAKTDKPTLIMPQDTNNKSGFEDIIKKQQERWECSTCLVRNPSDVKMCTSCGSYRPGVSQFKETTSIAPTFKFGIDNSNLKPTGFTFGATSSTESSTTPVSGFKFGSASITTEIPKTTANEFKFGAPTDVSTTPVSGFKFGASTSTEEPKSTTPVSEFKFGTNSLTDLPKTTSTPVSGFKIDATSTDVSKSNPPISGFKFGASETPKFSFGKTENKSETNKHKSDDLIEESPTKKSKESLPDTNKFVFGSSNKTENIFSNAQEITKPIFNFGTTEVKNITFDLPDGKLPEIPNETPKVTTTNHVTTPLPFVFNTQSVSTTSTTITETKSTFASTFQVPTFSFGSGGLPFNVKTTETNVVSTPTKNLFKFDANVPKPTEITPFAISAPAKPTTTDTFNFKPNNANPSFGFGGLPSSGKAFGFEQKSETPAFGGSEVKLPTMFGTSQQPQNGGFNFAPVAPSSTFKFGSSTSATTQAPVFSFGQAASSSGSSGTSGPNASASAPPPVFSFGPNAPTPAFTPDIKPNFNFTAGATPNFMAQGTASSSGAPVRKIRKAVRRMQPRQ